MNVLALDPGKRTGWCCYSTKERVAFASGLFEGAEIPHPAPTQWSDCLDVVVERPVGHGKSWGDVVDTAWEAGRLYEHFRMTWDAGCVHAMTRLDVKRVLFEACFGEIATTKDAGVWAALVRLHGEGSTKKGGALYDLVKDERAATALAVAWALRVEQLSFVNVDNLPKIV